MLRKLAFPLLALCGSEALVAAEVRWGSLRERIYAGQFLGVLPVKMADGLSVHRFDLPSFAEGPVSFGNIPSELNLSYLSVSANSQRVVGMGNLVRGSTGGGAFVQAVKTVLVTWAKASDWPEWAERDEAGYDHLVEAGIYGVQRSGAGEILDFEYVGASQCLVHVPWRPTLSPDGSPYPYNGYAFEVTIPFLDPVELPEEYVVLVSYDTESAGANPIGEPGPYDALNYGLRQGEPRVGVDPDPNSLVQVTPQGWNYSASWGGLGSVMTEVLSREEERMAEVSLEAPSDAGATVTALYDGEDLVEQALVRIRPRPVTLRALDQARTYGNIMELDESAFEVLDLDGDSVLPNGESVDEVELESVTGTAVSTVAGAGVYADEIRISGQEGSNGFSSFNYALQYVDGDLVVRRRAVTLRALDQARTYGDVMELDESAFEVLDLDGDSVLPNGESVDEVELESVTGKAVSTVAGAGVYADEIQIAGQEGSNGFNPSNYEVTYVRGDLLVRPAPVNIDLGERLAFRCGRGRGLWVQGVPEGVEVEIEYNGTNSIPGTLGEHEYRLRIEDPNYEASQAKGSFQIVERTYEVWSGRFLGATGFAGPEDDPDHDGISNLLEFALDTDPLVANDGVPFVVGGDGVFSGVVAKELVGASLAIEASSDLRSWREVVPSWKVEGGARVWNWTAPEPLRSFVRIRVDRVVEALLVMNANPASPATR